MRGVSTRVTAKSKVPIFRMSKDWEPVLGSQPWVHTNEEEMLIGHNGVVFPQPMHSVVEPESDRVPTARVSRVLEESSG